MQIIIYTWLGKPIILTPLANSKDAVYGLLRAILQTRVSHRLENLSEQIVTSYDYYWGIEQYGTIGNFHFIHMNIVLFRKKSS